MGECEPVQCGEEVQDLGLSSEPIQASQDDHKVGILMSEANIK